MDYRIQYQKFVDAVMDGFDENAEPDDQIAAAERFDRIRACFLAGDPMRSVPICCEMWTRGSQA